MSLLDTIKSWFGGGSSASTSAPRADDEALAAAAGADAGMAGATPPIADVGMSESDDEGMGAMSEGAAAPDPSGDTGRDPMAGEPGDDR